MIDIKQLEKDAWLHFGAELTEGASAPLHIFYQEFVDDTPNKSRSWPRWVKDYGCTIWTVEKDQARLLVTNQDHTVEDLLLMTMQARTVPRVFLFF